MKAQVKQLKMLGDGAECRTAVAFRRTETEGSDGARNEESGGGHSHFFSHVKTDPLRMILLSKIAHVALIRSDRIRSTVLDLRLRNLIAEDDMKPHTNSAPTVRGPHTVLVRTRHYSQLTTLLVCRPQIPFSASTIRLPSPNLLHSPRSRPTTLLIP